MGNAAGGGGYLLTDSNMADDSLSGDADDDFVVVPVIYFGVWDATAADMVDHSGEAFTPGLANLQPASSGTIVFPKQFGARNAAGDVFEAATSDIFGAAVAKYADDWDLYDRLMGEVHCATAAKRALPVDNWWGKQP
jgi:hypothetical protein